jgi:hypothetical protein
MYTRVRGLMRGLVVVISIATLSGCPTKNKQIRTAEGRCALILSQEEYDSGSIGGEAAWKGVELGKARITAEQAQVFKVELDKLQTDFNNMSHDICMDWAHGALTNQQYNEAKACLRSTHKKVRILSLGVQSGTVDGDAFVSQLGILMGEVDKCEPINVQQPVGNVQASSQQGTPCATDAQCVAPLYCILGGCRQLGNQNDQCAYDYDCVQPLACIGGVCSQASGPSTVLGSACENDSHCQAPLYCILGGCRYLGNVGDGCQFDYDCNAPMICNQGRCADAGGGASAVFGTACQSDANCTPPLFCIQKSCRPLGNPGDGCDIDQDCYSPYICSGGSCTVEGLKGVTITTGGAASAGHACTADEQCTKPNYCIVGQCRPLQPTGGICAINEDCVAGHTCVQSACQKSVTGTACKSDMDCNPPNYCIVGACRPLSGQGGICNIDADCMSPLRCVGGACSP